ncbi:outer membrane protein assembly factor BamB family protein [Streptomyces sp. DSM 40750]|uniref:serine/threonine-protein kinase n=1 Tax=Streptomyces sp. DSM 40750 TaxID=2801030 RepID=UPI00214CE293|nr:serine/threonine-protein kinase [Streptomyces sp. DSM 40750]UUU21632.1 serine/threonine-protein kinase [Streptomyces sp. DSM 40750]
MEAFEALEAGDPEQVGRYRIVARLGAGGMGRVYLGRSPGGRAVAVKVVRSELAEDGEFRRRFAREVAAARRVNGVFTAGVVDADPEGSPAWLATAYVPGVVLGDAVTAHGPWPQGPVLALGAGLAEALEAIHAAGVVHRDLKPSNIILAADGPRVIDFGISVAHEASALTRTGMVVGTPGFMSPEQLTGKPIGPASDVFSLGAVLAFTATGSGPFGTGSGHALSFRVVYEEPDLQQLPPVLGSVVARCLAKRPDQRPTVATLLDQLAEAADAAETDAEAEADIDTDAGEAIPRIPTQPGWLPAPVAATLHSRTTTHRPTVPSPASAPEQPAPVPAPAPAPTPTPAPEPTEPSDPEPSPPSLKSPEAATTGVRPTVLPTMPSRRRALLGLGGAAVAGLGFAGWKFGDGDSSTEEPGAQPDSSRRPGSSPTPTPTAPSGVERWKFATGDLLYASPTVAGGVVYIGSDSNNLYALDTATGGERWTFPAGGKVWTLANSAGVSSGPAVADGTVYESSADGNLYAVDVGTGNERWKFPIGKHGSSSPTVVDGVVYVGGGGGVVYRLGPGGRNDYENGHVYAVDAGTGEQRWKFTTRSSADAAPTVADGVVYAGCLDGTVYAVDAGTGKQQWKFTARNYVVESPVVVDGVVYVSSQDYNLYALDAVTGKQRWRFPANKGVSAPAVVDGIAYVGSGDGNLYAVDVGTGKQRWKFRVGKSVSAPVVAYGTVYVGSHDGSLYAVDAGTGKQQWKFRTGSSVYSTPAVADGVVYVSSLNGVLYAVT